MGRFIPYGPNSAYWFLVENRSDENRSDETMPSQGVIEIFGADATTRILYGRKPRVSGITQYGIVPLDIAARAVGLVVMFGERYATLTLKPGERIARGDRIGVRRLDWYLQVDDLGTAKVEYVVGDAQNDGESDITTTVLVTRVDRRGNAIFTRTPKEELRDPLHVWWLRLPLTHAEKSAGVGTISIVGA